MFCPKCGTRMEDATRFCENCGNDIQNTAPAPAPETIPVQPAAPAAPVYATPAYAPATMPIVPKKRHVGRIIAIVLVVALIGAIAWVAASVFGLLGPKNLGVKYTEQDYLSAMEKIGTRVTFEGMTGDALREYTKTVKEDETRFPIDEFIWDHSDFQERSFELTSAEASALLNEIAPAFWWFEDQQIHVLPDGRIEASGTGLLEKAIEDLYPELSDDIPFPMVEKVNLYASGTLSITENELDLDADTFKPGPIPGVSADTLNDNDHYFEALYTSVPGLIIHSLEINDKGGIEVDALIPQKTVITRR